MKKSHIKLEKLKLIGITAKTNNTFEMSAKLGKIPLTLEKYFGINLAIQIPNRKKPNTTYCIYTNYENEDKGDYTYFVGEEVNSFEGITSDFETLVIPTGDYVKFKVGPGVMPNICIDAWKDIWQMKSKDLGGKRNFIADFEIYDERSKDKQNAELDIYVGIIY
ncbi:MAG: effector binding domain-containing protein [Rickettsiales bacterium]|nr:effector binding domain-containing protein [Rickettsiales bacterium]